MTFNKTIATIMGNAESATILDNIYFWVDKNKANEKHFYDGKHWTYNSAKAFSKQFPWLSEKQIRTHIQKLEEKGFIETGNYNKMAYDRTKWYTVTEKAIAILEASNLPVGNKEVPQREHSNSPEVTPIPDINTDINTDINQINITKPKVSVNKQDITKKQASYSFESMKLAEHLLAKHKELDDRFTITNSALEKWACDIDKLMRIDKRDEAEIVQIITWAKSHDFWQSIILSGSSLRKHYSKLILQKNGKKNELPEGLQGKIMLDL